MNRKNLLGCLMGMLMLAFSACSNSDAPEVKPVQPHEGRTVLTFLWANNNLTGDLQANIYDMVYGLLEESEPATVLVYWDGLASDPNWKSPTVVSYTTDGDGRVNGYDEQQLRQIEKTSGHALTEIIGLGKVEKVYPDQISTQPKVMLTVLTDMLQAAPSKSYGLILGSHGSGWLPSITGSRSIGQDGDFTNNTVLIPELATILKTALQTVGQEKFDFLLFDACMMGSAEVCYELKDVTRHCLASVLDIPAKGFPYDRMLPDLFARDLTATLPDVCKAYIDAHNAEAWGTISWVDCGQMEALAAATRRLLAAYQDRMTAVPWATLQEYGRDRGFWGNTFVGIHCDMVQYLEELTGGELPASFHQTFRQAVRYTGYTSTVGPNYQIYQIDGRHYCGLGMYVPNYPVSPSAKAEFWNSYFQSSVAWYTAAGWEATRAGWEI